MTGDGSALPEEGKEDSVSILRRGTEPEGLCGLLPALNSPSPCYLPQINTAAPARSFPMWAQLATPVTTVGEGACSLTCRGLALMGQAPVHLQQGGGASSQSLAISLL